VTGNVIGMDGLLNDETGDGGHSLYSEYIRSSPLRAAYRVRRQLRSGRRRLRVLEPARRREWLADDTAVLVVTTGVDDELLGVDLRGHALERRVLSVDRGEIVKQRFGAADLDPRIRRESWLIDALLDAEPTEGWRTAPAADAWRRSGGAVLTRDAAVRALLQARLFAPDAAPERSLDADTLLAWSRTPAGAARFAELPPAEREGLTAWLRERLEPLRRTLERLSPRARANFLEGFRILAEETAHIGADDACHD
jgi:hypothetical protein